MNAPIFYLRQVDVVYMRRDGNRDALPDEVLTPRDGWEHLSDRDPAMRDEICEITLAEAKQWADHLRTKWVNP